MSAATLPLLGTLPAHALTGVGLPDTSFGNVQIGTTASRQVTLTNSSGVSLTVNQNGSSANDGQFTMTLFPDGVPDASRCTHTIPSGGTCILGVSVTPSALGQRQAVLSLDMRKTDASSYGTAMAQVTATAVKGSISIPTIDFGPVHVGDTANRFVELVNTGSGELQFNSLSANEAQFSASFNAVGVPSASWCVAEFSSGKKIQPGGRCSIVVSFSPSAGGARAAVLTIATSGGDFTTPVAGTGYRSGYWMLSANGKVYPFGDVRNLGDPSGALRNGVTALKLEPTPSGNGYWIVTSDGVVSGYGDATQLGSVNLGGLASGEQVTSMSSTPTGAGYWVFTSRGRAVPFGDAKFFGDMSATVLNGPVLGSVNTPSGKGYYMVASDGGIFAFGDAQFFGSMGGKALNAPVGAVVPNATNTGYWLVASDGGIFAFNTPFKGSMGGAHLNKPVVGMIRFGDGYLMVASDGGIFNFSNQQFYGSLGGNPPASPITSVGAIG